MMEACLVISFWMGHALNAPVVRCFADDRMRTIFVQLVNKDWSNDWLGMYYTRAEVVDSGRAVSWWEDQS